MANGGQGYRRDWAGAASTHPTYVSDLPLRPSPRSRLDTAALKCHRHHHATTTPLLHRRRTQVASLAALKERGLDPADMWRDYFVFSTSRNPWARAGSSYDYCSTKWARTSGPCRCVRGRQARGKGPAGGDGGVEAVGAGMGRRG